MGPQLQTLVDQNHLVMQTARTTFYGDLNILQPWGLIILLLSRAVSKSATTDVKQRKLAEITELIRTAHICHRNINGPYIEGSKKILLRNKILILLGDYLLSNANILLTELKNSDVNYIISSGMKNLFESEFFGEREPLPDEPKRVKDDFNSNLDTLRILADDVLEKPREEWTARTVFKISLLGRSCQSAMLLERQRPEIQNYGFLFGCNLGLAWQATTEIQKITSEKKEQFCLASAPVLFALQSNPDLYKIIDQAKNDVNDVDYEDLKLNILKTDAVDKTQKLYVEHAKKATYYVECIGKNEFVHMIKKLVNTH